ncbi:MAG: hypothetical protein HY287_00635 [Planctomycetes bacterium]|nr:hypothetical protein [Planctomycetota bacterium]
MGSATEQWNAAIEEKMGQGMDKVRATREVVHENPELHRAYIEEFNAARGRKARLPELV